MGPTNIFIVYSAHGSSGSLYRGGGADGDSPPLFHNQWTRSCLGINAISGFIQWVVDGALVLAKKSEEVKLLKERPKELGGKLILGAFLYGDDWYTRSMRVTNLNIFSSVVSREKMKSITNGESCDEVGDYLAWGEIDWILHGRATLETVDKEESCKGEPYVNFFYTSFPSMEACMHHCQDCLLYTSPSPRDS